MDRYFKGFIQKWYKKQDRDIEEAITTAESYNIETVEDLVGFLFTGDGFGERILYAGQRMQFFNTHTQYKPVLTELNKRKTQFLQALPEIKENPKTDIFMSYLLSCGRIDQETYTEKEEIYRLAGDPYFDINSKFNPKKPSIPDSYPRNLINYISPNGTEHSARMKFFGMFPMLSLNNTLINYKEIISGIRIFTSDTNKRERNNLNLQIIGVLSGPPILGYDFGEFCLDIPKINSKQGKPLWLQMSTVTALFS